MPYASHSRATFVRYQVLAFACVLSMITYLDRACFASAATAMATDLGLAATDVINAGTTAFLIAYSLFEVPAGWLGDRYGPRRTLLRIVLAWSLFTALTGLIGLRVGSFVFGGLGLLIALRLLFGAGEAGAYPNITRALHNWFPARQWAMAQGMVWMSGRIAGGLTPFIWAVLVAGTPDSSPLGTWRGAFLLFGFVGIVWCIAFALLFRNQPHEDPRVNEAERERIGTRNVHGDSHSHAIPWRAMLRSRSMLLLCLAYTCNNFGWWFHLSYLPTYMTERFSLAPTDMLAAIYKGGPLWIGAIGCLSGGLLADWLTRTLGHRRGRRMMGTASYAVSALCWLAALAAPNVHIFFLLVSLGALTSDMMLGASWATCQDIGQRNAAVVAATMNMIGGVGGILASLFTRAMVEGAKAAGDSPLVGYHDAFLGFAAAYVIASACWLAIDPTKVLVGRVTLRDPT